MHTTQSQILGTLQPQNVFTKVTIISHKLNQAPRRKYRKLLCIYVRPWPFKNCGSQSRSIKICSSQWIVQSSKPVLSNQRKGLHSILGPAKTVEIINRKYTFHLNNVLVFLFHTLSLIASLHHCRPWLFLTLGCDKRIFS